MVLGEILFFILFFLLDFGVGCYGIFGLNLGGLVDSLGLVFIFYLFEIGLGICVCGEILLLFGVEELDRLLVEMDGVDMILVCIFEDDCEGVDIV